MEEMPECDAGNDNGTEWDIYDNDEDEGKR